MKNIFIYLFFFIFSNSLYSQDNNTIKLNPPDTNRGISVMKALSLRASAKDFDTTSLKLQDLSDLLWAADGINRPESGKRTAPSAINTQDIDVYICLKDGIYLYDASQHILNLIVAGDYRSSVAGSQENFAVAPVFCVLVSDISRFKFGTDSLKLIWAAFDAGIVSQNISLFCASAGLSTRPRAYMDYERLREILKLKDAQYLMLNNPVSYKKE